jgi:glycosyltransferase involved in cell wall biosynthesis
LRILHLHKITGVSGSERHLLALLPALRERGVDARFLGLDVPDTDAGRFYEELQAVGVPFEQVRCTFDLNPRMVADVVKAVRRAKPDLLHTHLVHGDIYGSMASRVTRVPFVSTRHNDDRYLLGPFRHVDRLFARRAGRIMAISDAVRLFLERAGLPREKLVTVRYGLDTLPAATSQVTPAELGIGAGVPLLLAIGRLIAQKDHATLLRAFAAVSAEQPDAVLAILGGGPLEAETRQLVSELGLDDAVFLPGRLETRDWLERANIFVHTSRWEGFGIVLLEAMLAGLPIVATNVSAVPEVVEDGQTGVLVGPGDHDALAAALVRLLANPDEAARLGRAGLDRARAVFSVAAMTAATLAIYEEVCGSSAQATLRRTYRTESSDRDLR